MATTATSLLDVSVNLSFDKALLALIYPTPPNSPSPVFPTPTSGPPPLRLSLTPRREISRSQEAGGRRWTVSFRAVAI